MNAVRRKIESQKGASITFALLIFLVCAVVSSVVIVAGSTSAGRMSQIAEFDQRYYAVTSAAKLLKSDIDGKTLVVTYVEETEDGALKRVYHALYDGEETERSPDTILADASKLLTQYFNGDIETIPTRTFNLTPSIDGRAVNDLRCNVYETLGTNGLMTFTISNVGTVATTYRVEIVFASNRKETVDMATGQKKTILEWKFHSMKKVRNPLASGGEGGDGEDGEDGGGGE